MLVQAWAQEEKRPDYESAAWQPEPELAQPPPRPVSFNASFKLVGVVVLFVVGIMVCMICLPFVKHAYLTSHGVSGKGTIQRCYSVETGSPSRRTRSYYLVVQYETPAGSQLGRIQVSRSYYAGNLQGRSVPVHYLRDSPSQVVLDDDQFNPPWQVLVVLGLGVMMLWLPYYLYRNLRSIAENGTAVKGLITKINQRLKNSYLTVYYEFEGVAYQATAAVRPNRARADWRPGKVITLLVAPDPPSSPRRPHLMMIYPVSEFKINV